jgi:hypothetical protein
MEPSREEIIAMKEEIRDLKSEVRQTRHDVNDKIQDILLGQERNFAKKEDIYTKGELDRIFEAIRENTHSVKEFLEKHDKDDKERFSGIDKRFDKTDLLIEEIKRSSSNRTSDLLTKIIVFVLGGGLTWLLKISEFGGK